MNVFSHQHCPTPRSFARLTIFTCPPAMHPLVSMDRLTTAKQTHAHSHLYAEDSVPSWSVRRFATILFTCPSIARALRFVIHARLGCGCYDSPLGCNLKHIVIARHLLSCRSFSHVHIQFFGLGHWLSKPSITTSASSPLPYTHTSHFFSISRSTIQCESRLYGYIYIFRASS